jgi:hypothetical protein
MEELQLENICEQWKLTINSSKVSLKSMLLHNGNKFPAIQLTHAAHIKWTYENLQVLLQKYAMNTNTINVVN